MDRRASADARRGAAYTALWLGREEDAAAMLREGRASGVWAVDGQYPGELQVSWVG